MSNANVRVRRAKNSRMASTTITASPTNVRYEITFQSMAAIASNENKITDGGRRRASLGVNGWKSS